MPSLDRSESNLGTHVLQGRHLFLLAHGIDWLISNLHRELDPRSDDLFPIAKGAPKEFQKGSIAL